jgi:Fe-S-cluster-containing dehydrogenase component
MRILTVDLDRCVGCHACEVACKQEHNLPVGVNRIKLIQIGPVPIDDKLRSEYLPLTNSGCNICTEREKEYLVPACVETCPTEAIHVYDEKTYLENLDSKRKLDVLQIG